ncbi:hypothetical protein [Rhodococcus pyridinivorans]|uniref:hypothetical protein n=1 Tax=Rhodococcus pyridinivorans TaxID=103816 RepID=UPI003AAC866E
MNEWLRGERHWAEFFELKDQLELSSTGSHYMAAVLEDRELGAQAAQLPEPPPAPPSFYGYSGIRARLDDVVDMLLKLQATSAGVNPKEVAGLERPKPAVEIVRREIASSRLREVEQLLLRGQKGAA